MPTRRNVQYSSLPTEDRDGENNDVDLRFAYTPKSHRAIPWKSIALAIFLLLLGISLLSLSWFIFTSHMEGDSTQAYGLLFLGILAFLPVLDTRTMEFSMADRPPGPRNQFYHDMVIGEVGGGITGMFVLARHSPDACDLSYITRPNNDESSSQWSHQEKICSLGSESMLVGSTGRYLFIDHYLLEGSSCILSLDVETCQHQRVCASENGIPQPHAYINFPPPLSSPRLSSGIVEEEILGQGPELLRAEELKDGNHNDSADDDEDAGCQGGVSRIGDGAD